LDTLTNFIAIAFVIHFVWSYYFNCIRKGFTLDIWHYTLVTNLFVVHIMLPFSRNNLNVLTLGTFLWGRTQSHVNEAYFISTLGYIGILIGGSLWKVHLGAGLRRISSVLIELPTRGSLFLLQSKGLLIAQGSLALTLCAGLLAYYFSVAGFGLNFGSLIIASPNLRPLAQFATFYSILIASYCVARFIRYREKSMLYLTLGISTELLFFGSRSALLAIFLPPILAFFVIMRRRLRLDWLVISIVSALCFSIFLDALRRPNFSLSAVGAGLILSIFFGNSYSDTRDFAVILSFWDGHYLWGRTYLAGLFAFVPRVLSSFRDTWSLGVVTATMAGFHAGTHPGLRIGLFGEAYLNFGLVAVLLLGVVVGMTTRLIDLRMKQSAAALPQSGMRIYSYFVIATVQGAVVNSGNASTVYSVLLVFLVSWMAAKVTRSLNLKIF
jgi:hypothetical protein